MSLAYARRAPSSLHRVVLALALLACDTEPATTAAAPPSTGEGAPTSPGAAAAGAEPAPAAPPVSPPSLSPVPAPVPPPVTDGAFRFVEHAPPRAWLGLGMDAIGPEVDTHVVGDERSYAVRREGARVLLARRAPDGTQVYEVEVCADATGAPVLGVEAFAGVALVAVPTARGVVVLARSADDGAARSEVVAVPAPLDAPEVQLSGSASEVLAHVRTTAGAFLVRLDVERGAVLARSAVASDLSRGSLDAPASAAGGLRTGQRFASALVPGAHYVVRAPRGRPPELALRDASGTERWSHALDGIAGCTSAAIAEAGDAVVVASFCPSATGVVIDVLDVATGAARGSVHPYGIGSIGHSRYGNDVRVSIDGGRARVYGDESAGRYVSSIDLTTVAELSCLLERR